MKKITIFSALLIMLLLTPSLAFAQRNADERFELRQDRLEQRDQRKTDRMEEKETRQASRESRQDENIQERIARKAALADQHADRLERRFALYAKRLNSFITRIESRLDVLEAEGVDVSGAKTTLEQAQNQLVEAEVKANAAVAAFQSISATDDLETQKTKLEEAKMLVKETRTLFRLITIMLKDAVALAKETST